MLATANLPAPLKRFTGRTAVFQTDDAPQVAFPPDGASVFGMDGGVTVKLREGTPPFSLLANDTPRTVRTYDREIFVSGLGKGASTITVIDAKGQSDHVQILGGIGPDLVDTKARTRQVWNMNQEIEVLGLLPARLKDARRAQGLSLDAVAKLSGVSRSMVSQIERGESSPTIATLWNLTRALNVDFAGLLEADDEVQKVEILRSDETPSIENQGEGCTIRILSPPEDAGKHELYDLLLDAGGQLDSKAHVRGTREHLTVISGQVRVCSGSATGELSEGDTARYAADVPHVISAPNGPARALLVVQTS